MKVKQNMFSLFGSISKYKAFGVVEMSVLIISNMLCHMVLYQANTCREELQIRYANLRV